MEFKPLSPRLWWVAGAPGEADANNRGHVANLLVGQSGGRLWVIGSGPSPVFGANLNCHLRSLTGQGVTDVISAWPSPESVSGVTGLGTAQHWGHEDVAQAMQQRCAGCIERLAHRMGVAAADLGANPIQLPQHRFSGTQGRLGPWRWWRLWRGAGLPVTVWQWQNSPVRFAPGLLWDGTAPSGWDTEAAALAQASLALAQTPTDLVSTGSGLQWLGEQGGLMHPSAPKQHAHYWTELERLVQEAIDRGDDPSTPPALIQGQEAISRSPAHALNWQRTWRQLEEGSLQRSRR